MRNIWISGSGFKVDTRVDIWKNDDQEYELYDRSMSDWIEEILDCSNIIVVDRFTNVENYLILTDWTNNTDTMI